MTFILYLSTVYFILQKFISKKTTPDTSIYIGTSFYTMITNKCTIRQLFTINAWPDKTTYISILAVESFFPNTELVYNVRISLTCVCTHLMQPLESLLGRAVDRPESLLSNPHLKQKLLNHSFKGTAPRNFFVNQLYHSTPDAMESLNPVNHEFLSKST